MSDPKEFYSITQEGDQVKATPWLHPGQMRAWNSTKRIIAIIAGVRSGKTIFGPPWLWREICRCGPGNYMVVGPTYRLLEAQAIPEFQKLFRGILNAVEPHRQDFRFTPEGEIKAFGAFQKEKTVIRFCHADDPYSLASITAKAVWGDEVGIPKFKYASHVELCQRVAIHRGRILYTTTPYALGWLKDEIFDRWERSGENHPLIDVVRFKSIENPSYDIAEYEQAKATLPSWQFAMRHEGCFTRPAGSIYDCWDDALHFVTPEYANTWQNASHPLSNWPIYLGLDFGGANTAGVFFAEEVGLQDKRTGRYFVYKVYGPCGNKSAAQHVADLKSIAGRRIQRIVGGAKGEGQWRTEFGAAGLQVEGPGDAIGDTAVQVGIDRVYGAIKRGELYIVDDGGNIPDAERKAGATSTQLLRNDVLNYSRELDDRGEPTEDIADKETWHRLDAVRYLINKMKPMNAGKSAPQAAQSHRPGWISQFGV